MAEHGFTGKWLMYEESIRVPGFIFDPRHITKGASTREMVLNIDLAPTILELAGVKVPENMQGKSLIPLLEDPDKPFREDFFYEHLYRHLEGYQHIERSEGVRTMEWKYIHYIDQTGSAAEELYNLTTDSNEMQDLSKDPGPGKSWTVSGNVILIIFHQNNSNANRPAKCNQDVRLLQLIICPSNIIIV